MVTDTADPPKLTPGWYVRLEGHKFDLEEWVHALNEPFDPVALKEPGGAVVLTSCELRLQEDANTIREQAEGLISRLNGTMALTHSAGPVTLHSLFRIDENGARHHVMVVHSAVMAVTMGRALVRATGVAIGPDGRPLPPPPPQPSQAQIWAQLATSNTGVADLLEQLGKAKDWYDIYKTLELAEYLIGGQREVAALLGEAGGQYKNLRTTANHYRHARGHKPARPTTMGEATPLLYQIVREVLAKVQQLSGH